MDEAAKKIFLHHLQGKKYEKGITLLTPTGDRPQCIERCSFYIERQDFKLGPIQWLISDDSEQKSKIRVPNNVNYFTHLERTYPGNKSDSFRGNIITSLPHIVFDKVLIIEDDDWYASNYITTYHSRLLQYQLVGEGPARYYNVKYQIWRVLGNAKRASFCQTALRTEILDKLFISCQRDSAFVDARLWNKDCRKFIFQDKAHCIGIKGMPGRLGIGMGHRCKTFQKDKEWQILEKWIGKEDTEFYKSIM